jgi:membrane protein implicated in regulation of membrane protease activity
VTYMSLTEGFNRWGYMYVFAVLSLVMYLMKRFMMKRYEKHMQYLEEQTQKQKES